MTYEARLCREIIRTLGKNDKELQAMSEQQVEAVISKLEAEDANPRVVIEAMKQHFPTTTDESPVHDQRMFPPPRIRGSASYLHHDSPSESPDSRRLRWDHNAKLEPLKNL